MERFLSPLVTPLTLYPHPIRELQDLRKLRQIPFQWKKVERHGLKSIATLELWLGSEAFIKTGSARIMKIARKNAAQGALSLLSSRGIIHPRRLEQSRTDCDTLIDDVNASDIYDVEGSQNHKMRALEDGEESSSKNNIASNLGGKHVIEGELDETGNISSYKDYDNTPKSRNPAFDGGVGSDVTKKIGYSDVTSVEVQSSKDSKALNFIHKKDPNNVSIYRFFLGVIRVF